jgi:hypothetical protein
LLTEYDILIAIFATKLGSPTPSARSGTIEEIEHAIANDKSPMGKYRVQVYFRDKLESTSDLLIDDFKDVIEYREALKPRGILFGMFKERDDLQREVRVNIQRPILDFLASRLASSVTSPERQGQENDRAVTDTEVTTAEAEELGLLDYQERAELSLQTFNDLTSEMATLLNEIANEMNRSIAEISDVAFVRSSATAKKNVINGLSTFLKSKSAELQQKARLASESFDAFTNAVIPLAEIERQGDTRNYDQALAKFLAEAEKILASIGQARVAALSFRNTVESIPRITIQFNKAKKWLLEAVDESLRLFDRAEKGIYEITART